MITREIAQAHYPSRPLGEVVDFLDNRRKPVKKIDRTPGPYPYYGANGKQGTIDSYLFDEPLLLLAEDGGLFDEPDRGIAYRISGKTWVNNHAHVIRPKNGLDMGFLYRTLENYDVRPYINGSTRSKLTKTQATQIVIPLPPLAEQKRIAAILDQADALRRLRKRALDKLGSLGQSIFYDMFGDPRTNPHQYKIFQFGDLGEIKLGKMLDRGKVRGDKSLPYLRNANVRWFSFDLHDVSEMDFFESEFDRFRVMPDDLLICEGGEPGRCAIWNDAETEIYYQKALHRARFDTTLALPEYVAHWIYLAATLGMLIDSVSSATIAHLTGQKLKKLSLMIPPIEKQRSFVRVISELNELSENTSSALASDESLFAALQQRAFRGEL